MAGSGREPKDPAIRRNRARPRRGEWQAAPGVGWQHGPIPEPPDGIGDAARAAWGAWFRAWFAAHWLPEDLPVLRLVALLFDRVATGPATGTERAELRQLMDSYGITPKGRQDRRWSAPKADEAVAQAKPAGRLYGHLRAIGGD